MDLARRIYGPPGTGKTRELTDLACKAAARFGPERTCALTYTRAAASELKERIAAALGLRLPPDPYERARRLGQDMPWVGTIHALAYKLAGKPPVLGRTQMKEFLGGWVSDYPDRPEDAEGYEYLEPGKTESEQALALYAMARHRMVPLAEAYDIMPWGPSGPQVTPERAAKIVRDYEDFKAQKGMIDFEDMLLRGGAEVPPVDIILSDEVQDNSPLLWCVTDTWANGLLYVMAGDPYQALYIWSGAEPRLFIDHPGTLIPLGDSHRLTQASAQRAQRVLQDAGFTEREWLGSWGGLGEGEARDGTTFWLARTGRLVREVQQGLEDQGIPYGYLRGGGPLERKESRAYRTILMLREQGSAPVGMVKLLADEMDKGWLPHGEKARLERLARVDPTTELDIAGIEATWGTQAQYMQNALPHGRYYQRIYRDHGILPFVQRPATMTGTIHASKGREADTVHLVESWGSLPYRAIYNGQQEAEACVAYVGLTRHRAQLVMEPASEGSPYPW